MATRTSTGRTLGLGLMAAGGVIGVLGVILLLAITRTLGGFVLSLIFVLILALPLVIGGYYLLRRSEVEAQAQAEFSERSRILDADRLVRSELTRQLAGDRERVQALQLRAPDPALAEATARLQTLARAVEQPAYAVESAWYSAVQLDEGDVAAVRSYDDLVLDQARRVGSALEGTARNAARPADVLAAVRRLETVWQERNDLLLRGRRAVRAGDLLAGREIESAHLSPADLNLGDALSYEGDDYLVQAKLGYFAGDRAWTMLRLVQSKAERWLLAGPSSGELFWLEPAAAEAAAGLTEVDAGTATVTIATPKRTEGGIFVEYHRFQAPGGGIVWTERWPDHQRAYQGRAIRAEELELWPRGPEAQG